ncbi:nucleotide sugar dehydrogenase [Saccharopolyspora sp. WRP15-2]|uniref:Nucleotide sugar dehydrogenase n=1 Tax=Saccharopolyspora oryzae TaxID=2997343 RepID=A0ABT4UR28_9PSEU|nr:nucleotide sugar dehydrogenase [Saccharopolyspora oryzae]MDA3624186.1 nucleotide sugar dehydrogenase [Saccharopolyspora oryzae]
MITSTGHRVVVIGQGYVGLPLAMRAVEVGFDVVGFDTDKNRVDLLGRGSTFIDDIGDAELTAALATGRYLPTSDHSAMEGFDTAVVCVPTPLREGAPDLDCIEQAARTLAGHVTPGCCVILESTTYPGTTDEVFLPILEAGSGLRAGVDFAVGYSPERIDPGNPAWQFHNTPKIVSGVDGRSLRAVQEFYDELVDRTVAVRGTREAELTKLLENTFRHVNIALVNELAMYCHGLGVDVWSVIDAAASKPFGFMRFSPGPGVGGHCLPIDPSYLSWQVRRSLGKAFRFVEIANDVNEHMPDYVVARAVEHLNRRHMAVNGSRILLLGLSYKANSSDARLSPAMGVAKRLHALGAELRAVDPLIDEAEVPVEVAIVPWGPEQIERADLVIVLTDHDAFDWVLLERHADRVFDTRNRLRAAEVERL